MSALTSEQLAFELERVAFAYRDQSAEAAARIQAHDMAQRQTIAELREALKAVEARLTTAARAFYVDGKQKALQVAFDGWKPDVELARTVIAKAEGRA